MPVGRRWQAGIAPDGYPAFWVTCPETLNDRELRTIGAESRGRPRALGVLEAGMREYVDSGAADERRVSGLQRGEKRTSKQSEVLVQPCEMSDGKLPSASTGEFAVEFCNSPSQVEVVCRLSEVGGETDPLVRRRSSACSKDHVLPQGLVFAFGHEERSGHQVVGL